MRICKYCKKPISDGNVWNPDGEGNGYHHSCLCEMEFRSRDKQIYDKGKTDALDKIRAEIGNINLNEVAEKYEDRYYGFQREVIKILDKYKGESEK